MPRPTKLNPDTQKAIVDAIAIGATYADAAGAAGVDYMTFRNWMTQGEATKRGIYFEFFDAVRKAEATARLNYTRTIASAAAGGDWKAALEYLKRRDRANWGDNLDMTSNQKDVVQFDYAKLLASATPRPTDDNNEPGQD